MNLLPVTYKILYNQKDITRDISDQLLSLSYADKVSGESDEMNMSLQDKDGLWQNEWNPTKGDSIEISIIDGDLVLNCGRFTIDEKQLSCDRSGADVFDISGLAAVVTKQLRTKRITAHENKTLRQIAQAVADRHGLTVQGTIPAITFSRVTQNRENDLAFLNRIAGDYGMLFSVRDNLLVFTISYDLEKKTPVFSIDKTEIISGRFNNKSESTFKSVTVSYHNPEKNEKIEKKASVNKASDPLQYVKISKPFLETHTSLEPLVVVPPEFNDSFDDYLKQTKVDNAQQAEMMAATQQRKIITQVETCSVTVPGNVLLVSGMNVELTGFGKCSGIFHITESAHSLDRASGYITSFEAKKVDPVQPAKYKPKKKKNNTAGRPFTIIVNDFDGTDRAIATSRIVGDSEIITIQN